MRTVCSLIFDYDMRTEIWPEWLRRCHLQALYSKLGRDNINLEE